MKRVLVTNCLTFKRDQDGGPIDYIPRGTKSIVKANRSKIKGASSRIYTTDTMLFPQSYSLRRRTLKEVVFGV